MKSLCKFAQWFLAGIALLLTLSVFGKILPMLLFAAAIAVMLPPIQPFLTQKVPPLKRGWVKFLAWFLLLLIAPSFVPSPQTEVNRLKAKQNVPALIALLDNTDQRAALAATALGDLDNPQAVEPLINTLQTASDDETRQSAATALGELQDPRAVELLMKTANDSSSEVAEASQVALQKLAATDPEIAQLEAQKDVPALIGIFQQQDYRAAYVAQVLGELGDPQAVEPLITVLPTASDGTIKSVNGALKQLASVDSNVVPLLVTKLQEGNPKVKGALIAIGAPAVDPLIALLQAEDVELRIGAAEMLGQIGDARAIPPLVEQLTDWNTRKAAGSALQALKWQPASSEDKVHFWVAQGKKVDLAVDWETTKQVLISDVESGQTRRVEYALYSFMGVGNQEIIPVLVDLLNAKGNVDIALAYLNCGEPTLEQAAKNWANANGYEVIQTTESVPMMSWGETL